MAFPTEWIYQKCVDAVSDIYGSGMVEKTRPWLEVSSTGNFAGVWGFIEAGCNVFIAVGTILAVIYFVINLSEKSISQGATLETFAKYFIEFCLALLLIANAFRIVEFASSIGSGVLTDVGTIASQAAEDETTPGGSLLAEIDEINTGSNGIGKFMKLLLFYLTTLQFPALLAAIGRTLVIVACMARGISIIIYGVFLPIPIADVYKDGLNSKGIRYIKKFIGLFLQGAVILLVVIASSYLQGSVSQESGLTGALYSVGLIFVTVMIIFKSQSITNDIVGV